MKFSKQRELILNEVMNSHLHPTADSIYTNLKKDNPGLSLGTVYRNLTQLIFYLLRSPRIFRIQQVKYLYFL